MKFPKPFCPKQSWESEKTQHATIGKKSEYSDELICGSSISNTKSHKISMLMSNFFKYKIHIKSLNAEMKGITYLKNYFSTMQMCY